MTLAVLVTLFGMNVRMASPVAADENTDMYRAAMDDLVDLTNDWARELRTEIRAVSIKPELACTVQYYDLVNHGIWLAQDLEGSAYSAPAEIAAVNFLAAEGLMAMVEGARTVRESCDGTGLVKGVLEINNGYDTYRPNATRLQLWIDGPDAIRAAPRIPILPGL